MQTTTRKHIHLLFRPLYAMMVLAYASCSSVLDDLPECTAQDDDGISVSIRLTGQPKTETRSVTDEYGSVADNYINYKDLYVMTYSLEDGRDYLTDGSEFIEVMWQPGFADASYSGTSTVSSIGDDVFLKAQLNKDREEYKEGKNFCIVAVANIGSFANSFQPGVLAEGKTFADLRESMRANFRPTPANKAEWSWVPDNKKGVGIPMFGVKKVNLRGYDTKIFSAWNPYELHSADGNKELKLLRAFAKVVLELKEGFSNPTGQDVRFVSGGGIGKSYSGGFKVIPRLDRMEEFISKGETGQISQSPSTVDENDIITGIKGNPSDSPNSDLQFAASADGRYAYLYLPEYDLGTTEDDHPDLTVQIAFGGVSQNFTFKLKQYNATEGDQPLDWRFLLRNHCYRFIIDFEYGKISVVATEWEHTYENVFDF